MNQLRELAELIRPGMGMGAFFGRGRGGGFGGGGPAGPVEPGTYTVTVKIGERALTRTMVVEEGNPRD